METSADVLDGSSTSGATTRLKLEIPCSYDSEQDGFGKEWFRNITNTQEGLLKKVFDDFKINCEHGYKEHADEADTACQQKFYTISYKISSDSLKKDILKAIKKFFESIKCAKFPAFLTPLLIMPTGECFHPHIITCHNDVMAGALFFGNIQGGVFFNHWEISMDLLNTNPPKRCSDKIFVNFEYDKEEIIMAHFKCQKHKREGSSFRVDYRILITRKSIRRIIVDNSVHDKFGSGKTRINFELTTPFIIREAQVDGDKKKLGKDPHYQRETTIKHGRKENEYPKDADLTDCPFFTVEFAQKVENTNIFSIISRLRARTSLPIEFGTFPIVDAIMKMKRPYFEWLGNILPTGENCSSYQKFLNFCFPRNYDIYQDKEAHRINERNRFIFTFLIECLLSRGPIVKDQLCLQEAHWVRFIKIVALQIHEDVDRAERALERLVTMIDERKRIGSINKTLIMIFDAIKAEDNNPYNMSVAIEPREGYQRVRKVIITPTRTIYVVPEMMMSNRVLRKFDPDGTNVLRVAFRDDNAGKMRSQMTTDDRINKVVGGRLKFGMIIAGRHFGYLGSSNSQMRDHGAYFMQKMSEDDINEYKNMHENKDPPESEITQILYVRKKLGKFSNIESIPKMMARLGQCFTQSKESGIPLSLDRRAYTYDVVGGVNSMGVEFTFTDGVGMISEKFAIEVARDFGIVHGRPSCYQFRYRGMKGVLGVDNYLDEHNNWVEKIGIKNSPKPKPICDSWIVDIVLRRSQEKFYGARQNNIEVVKVSSPSPVSLNRPFINILDQVSMMQGYHVHKRMTTRIEQLLDRQLRGFATQMIDETACRNRLKELPRRIDIDKLSRSAGFEMSNEVFFRSLIKASVKFSVSKQLSKAQIQIPFENGRTLLGIADETGRLQYGQVYCQVTKSIRDKYPPPNAAKMILTGSVLITKNPCIVAGDVRIFEAIDIPELHHLVDVIVFPIHGPRPHPDEMAGSDLDGDEYCVIWDKELLLERNEEPFDFAVPKRVDSLIADTEIQAKMSDFYIKYMTQDQVGTISNAFLVASDLFGINHKVCMSLAKKNSEAVDFTKSGRPPAPLTKEWTKDEVTEEEIPPEKSERQPDYMATDLNRPMYESPRLLGRLNREIRRIEDVMRIAADRDEQIPIELDPYLYIDGWEKYKSEATEALDIYNSVLRTMMETYGIRTEAEIFSGCITDIRNRLSDKDQDDMSFFNTTQIIETKLTNLFRQARIKFFEAFGGWMSCTERIDKPFADERNVCHRECKNPTDDMQKKAVAYYILCYERAKQSGERKLSFAWLPYEILAHVKQERIRTEPPTISGNPLFQLLENHMNVYIEEHRQEFEKFRLFDETSVFSTATEPIVKYCRKYDGLDKLLFIVHEWGSNLQLFTYRFSSTHLSMLVIMYFINAFASLDGDALQILEPIPLKESIEELEPQVFGNQSRLFLKFMEFLSSRKFGRMLHINFRPLGVQALFCRGEWMPFHNAAMTTYHNMVYNLRFEEIPLKSQETTIGNEIIRECEPFTIELPEEFPNNVRDEDVIKKMKEKSGAVEVHFRRLQRNKVLVSARGTLESLDRLRKMTTVRPPLSTGACGREIIEQLFKLVYDNIMKEEVIDGLDRVTYDSYNRED